VLYFFQRAQVESLFRAQAEAADARRANLEVAFDYASPFGAWIVTRRPAHRQLGTTFHWTLHNPASCEASIRGSKLVEDSNVFLNAMGTGAPATRRVVSLVSGSQPRRMRAIFAAFPLLNVNIQTGWTGMQPRSVGDRCARVDSKHRLQTRDDRMCSNAVI